MDHQVNSTSSLQRDECDLFWMSLDKWLNYSIVSKFDKEIISMGCTWTIQRPRMILRHIGIRTLDCKFLQLYKRKIQPLTLPSPQRLSGYHRLSPHTSGPRNAKHSTYSRDAKASNNQRRFGVKQTLTRTPEMVKSEELLVEELKCVVTEVESRNGKQWNVRNSQISMPTKPSQLWLDYFSFLHCVESYRMI